MTTKQSALNWFEIPSVNFERAVKFYNQILGTSLRLEVIASTPNAIFPYDSSDESHAVGGAVFYDERVKPSLGGTTAYLNCNGQLPAVLARVESAGGKIMMPITDIGFGFIALVIDSEGNRVGLHSA